MSKKTFEDEELEQLLLEKEANKNKPKAEPKKDVKAQTELDASNYLCFSYFKNKAGRYEIVEIEFNPYKNSARIKEFYKMSAVSIWQKD